MRVLFLENHDSFSWNVVETLPMRRADIVLRPSQEAADDPDALAGVSAVVMGPGPTDPVRAGLLDLVRRVADERIPFLGVCLGHQALGLAFGAHLVRTTPTHGKRSAVAFRPSRLFPGITGRRVVMRYHSLSLAGVAAPLRVVAKSADGLPMAIEHESLPLAGLQFHPDSYATPGGRRMLAAFFEAVG